MQFLFQYPDVSGTSRDMLAPGPVADVARVAEQAGWDGLSFTEHPAPSAKWLEHGGHQSLDPFVALGHAAAVTERLRFLTFLTVVPYRNPLLLAKSAATVDKLSGGRFVLGAGVGYLKSEYRALGIDFDERNALFDEALDVLPLHWSGEPFSYEGTRFSAREVQAMPRPVQQPIPIWLGGNSRRTKQRVAERAQGWMPMMAPAEVASTARTPHMATIDDVAAAIAEIKDLAGERGDSLDFVVSYHDRTASMSSGDIERHRDALGAIERAGATWIVTSSATVEPSSTYDFLHAFAETYIAGA